MTKEITGCKCKDQQQPHTCPYSEDIDGDHETLCTCCTKCTNECANDI